MSLPILLYTDPILHKPCAKIEAITDEIKTLAEEMVQTMMLNDGVGLAANQVGKSLQLCVM